MSIATVSYVLNNKPGQSISEDTRKKVLQFANLLGYECNVMAKYLATGKSNTVGAVIKDINPFASQYYLKMLAELSRLLFRKNFSLKLVDFADGMEQGSAVCDAFITVALSEKDFRAFADTKFVPVIAVDTVLDDFLFYRVNDDYSKLAETAKKELNCDAVSLLTFDLPGETLDCAAKHFDGVTVIKDLNQIAEIDSSRCYATVSSSIFGNAAQKARVYMSSASFALKASAAAQAVTKAIDRSVLSAEGHDIKV